MISWVFLGPDFLGQVTRIHSFVVIIHPTLHFYDLEILLNEWPWGPNVTLRGYLPHHRCPCRSRLEAEHAAVCWLAVRALSFPFGCSSQPATVFQINPSFFFAELVLFFFIAWLFSWGSGCCIFCRCRSTDVVANQRSRLPTVKTNRSGGCIFHILPF